MAHILGGPAPDIQKGIADFRGAGRRFEVLGKVNGATLADDYAHHPTELGAVSRLCQSSSISLAAL